MRKNIKVQSSVTESNKPSLVGQSDLLMIDNQRTEEHRLPNKDVKKGLKAAAGGSSSGPTGPGSSQSQAHISASQIQTQAYPVTSAGFNPLEELEAGRLKKVFE